MHFEISDFLKSVHKRTSKNIIKKTITAALILTASLLSFNTISVSADEATSSASIQKLTYKIADLDVVVKIPADLVTFTRSVTDNNQYLKLIGADSAMALRTSMEANNVYLETIPKENVTYEFILSGKNASLEAVDFNKLSNDELNTKFDEYIKACDNIDNEIAKEKVNSSSIERIGDNVYFVTDITSVANNLVTVQIKKYYTCIQGKNISFTIQTTENAITDEMNNLLVDIVTEAEYREVKSSIFDNPLLSDILATVFTLLVPIVILALIIYIMNKSTRTKKKTK